MAEKEFDILDLVEEIAREQSTLARIKGIQINPFAEPQIHRRWVGDRDAIRAALSCLVVKALSETVSGAVVVEVLEAVPLTNDKIRFAVTDSRTNLTYAQQEAMRDQLLTQNCNGVPLARLLESMGASLHFDERVLGRATRFFFSGEIHAADSVWLDYPLCSELLETKFFLVANDPYPNRSIQRYCRHHGLVMEGAPTASESLSVLGKAAVYAPFDVLGVAPPIEDLAPFELARAVRASDHLAAMKLLYIAEQYDPENLRAAIESGFDATLSKPFTKRELFLSLARLTGLDKYEQPCPIILVVDDNPVNQRVATFQVRLLGFEALAVGNGKEALTALEHTTFAAILMDLQMPVMDGIEATKKVRELEKGLGKKRVPIIALTANADMKDEALAAGCNDFLLKPASKDTIKNALAQLLPTILSVANRECKNGIADV